MKFWNPFRKKREQEFVAGKMGLITICEWCHRQIHLEDADKYETGNLDEEDGYFVWVHRNNKVHCHTFRKHYGKSYRQALPMRVDF